MPTSQSSPHLTWALLLMATFGALLGGWWFFKPSYDISYHTIPGCPQPLTSLMVSQVGHDRGLYLIAGRYAATEPPTQDYVYMGDLSGFDASFQCVVTCENGRLIVNHYEASLKPRPDSGRLTSRRLYSEDWSKLRASGQGTLLEFF
ncbi:hypothetical protein [Hymenobacter sp. CRA2]|uniref:hypothetical protein n=1 Tax=Hymenobacter sp. CRA2 TaxID=1955620 RepID=UPI00098EB39F|nr:hypothetical protein [Hymenobacter sp. CRA2]OON70060.1 hypothetical protein B0919_04760 [Hymenobacter sp. CRA2]